MVVVVVVVVVVEMLCYVTLVVLICLYMCVYRRTEFCSAVSAELLTAAWLCSCHFCSVSTFADDMTKTGFVNYRVG